MALIGQPDDCLPIDCGRDCSAKIQVAKPDLLASYVFEFSEGQVIQIEDEKVELQTWTKILDVISATLLLPGKDAVIVWPEAIDDVGLTALKTQRLCVFSSDK